MQKEFNFVHLSTGELLRKEVEKQGPLGEEISKCMIEGKLVPSDILVKLLKNAMEKEGMHRRFLIDGFPRSKENMQAWDTLMKQDVKVPVLIFFDCSEEAMINRIKLRGASGDRKDDNEETIKVRLETYRNETEPVLKLFDQSIICKINAEGDPEEIYNNYVRKAIVSNTMDK
jgi:adenylate kinase family enzyme